MKITISELKKLINEEIVAAMKEGANDGPKTFFGDTENIFDEKQKPLSVPEKHQLAVAYKTLKTNPAIAGVMGGMSKDEAREVIKKLTGKVIKEERILKELRVSSIAQKYVNTLEILDNKVWDYNNFESGNDVRQNWKKYTEDLQKVLVHAHIDKAKTLKYSKEISEKLEDDNFASLLEAMTILGYLNLYKY
jgi:thymidylate synthase